MPRSLRILTLVAVAALAAPAVASAYDWPLRPYKTQHPIRGGFDDPRITYSAGAAVQEAFHFGVDISAPDLTPVYSVSNGTALPGAQKVRIKVGAGGREFAYWHIYPAVRRGQKVKVHQLLGYIARGHAHVLFAEKVGGVYVNPVHRGGLTPYADHTRPTVASVSFSAEDRVAPPDAVAGVVDVVADAYDTPALAPPEPWNSFRVTPALVRWRIIAGERVVTPWQVAVDFRWAQLPQSLFDLVYAPSARQNKVNRPGNYPFYLRQEWDTTELPNGAYTLEVEASDMRDNVGKLAQPFVIAN